MFSQYNYFVSKISKIKEINTLVRISGISGMEELNESIRDIKPLILAIEDDADGFLDLSNGNYSLESHSFLILDVVKNNSSADRSRALAACMQAALKIFKMMMADSADFGDPCYGFDRSKVDYQRIGPLANNTFGFLFTYVVKNENFILELPEYEE